MGWFRRRAAEVAPDPFIRPEHVCRPPRSRLFAGGPKYSPEDHEDCPAGTRWICGCGRAWVVTPSLMCWERDGADDVEELLG